MKYASIYITFNARILDDLVQFIELVALSNNDTESCKSVLITGSSICVVCITGPSEDLKSLFADIEECMLSEDARDSFFSG